jgi:PAS domain S-box-containing protein
MLASWTQVFDSSDSASNSQSGDMSRSVVGWLEVSSDLVISAAFFAITLLLVYYTRRQKYVAINRIVLLVAMASVMLGLTQLIEAAQFWWPAYRLTGLLKTMTAFACCISLIFLIRAMPPHFDQLLELLDTTARNRADERVDNLKNDLERQVQDRTAELLEAQRLARVGSCVLHVEEDRLTWTEEIYRIFGVDSKLPPPSFTQHETMYTAESWSRLRAAVQSSIESGTPFALELEIRRIDGTFGTITSHGEVERDSTGRVVRLRGTKQDISELRQAEAETRRVSERLQLAAEAGKVGIWDWDISNNVLKWDQAMYTLYGISAEQFAGAYEAWQAGVHPDDRVISDQHIQLALQGKKTFDTEFRVFWPDKSVHFIRAHGVVRRSSTGEPVRMVGTNWDITEIKRAEESIQRLNEKLKRRAAEVEEANKELEAFSYSVSHDLRAPLRAISGFSQILMEDHNDKLPPDAQDSLREVYDNARRMGQLIDDLLAFSRLGRQGIKKSKISVETIVRQCVSAMNKDQTIEFHILELPSAFADAALIKQVWHNLIENAIKYSRSRTPPVVEIGAIRGQVDTIYFVKDNGVGFDMQYSHKLFKVFNRLHHQEEFEGTGVGLAIVQRVIGRHGGRVWVNAKPNSGATFFFSLPTEEGAQDE